MNHAVIRILFATCLLNIAAVSMEGQDRSCSIPSLEATVDLSGFQGGELLGTILEVGRRSGVCFGVDVRDNSVLKKRVTLTQGRLALREILALVGAPASRFTNDGVLYLRFGDESADWLDETIPKFRAEAGHIELASAGLYVYLCSSAHPGAGLAGDTPYSISSPLIKPILVSNRRVASILDAIISSSSRGGMWFTVRSHALKLGLPSSIFWNILVYSDPSGASRLLINEAIERQP